MFGGYMIKGFILFAALQVACAGNCVWYGECGTDPDTGKPLNCPDNKPARELKNKTSIEILRDICPDLVTGDVTKTCCDSKQILSLQTSITLPQQLLSRCPSCLQNFLNMFCRLTCDPNQSDFVAAQIDPVTMKSVITVDYVVSEQFAYGMYNSCLDVQMPSNNQKVLGVLCGQDASECTPEKLLHYLGDKGNKQTPLGIKFKITNEPYLVPDTNITLTPMNASTTPCSGYCSCQDCRSSCGEAPPPCVPASPWSIIGIEAMDFIAGVVCLSFVLVFSIFLVWSRIFCDGSQTGLFVNHYSGAPGTQHEDTVMSTAPLLDTELSDASCCHKFQSSVQAMMQSAFGAWGRLCARHPLVVVVVSLIVCAVLTAGISCFHVMTDPVELWSDPTSQARVEKKYFEDHFTPFYRTEQLIITPGDTSLWMRAPDTDDTNLYGPALRKDFLEEVLSIQQAIEDLQVWSPTLNQTVTLADICFTPLSPDNSKCAIMSALNYYQNNRTNLDLVVFESEVYQRDYIEHFLACSRSPTSPDDGTLLHLPCMAAFGGPILPWVVLGGYPSDNYANATVLVVTFLVNNFPNKTFQQMAMDWELGFLDYVSQYNSTNITMVHSAERSVEDEINRESRSDVYTVLISYFVMFFYVAITLGNVVSFRRLFVDSKILLGLAGVVIVLLSVTSAIGLFSYAGVPATLIIVEVIPFLVLAVGVDNIFILVQTLQRVEKTETKSVEDMVSETVGQVGPSILLTSMSECVAFGLGVLTKMPAVRVFAMYACMAVFIDFLLQISCFVALMTLDARRQLASRMEPCCCVRISGVGTPDKAQSAGVLYRIVKNYYAPFLLSKWMRPIVMFVFVAWFCFGVAVVNKVEKGLDQNLSMPKDSYLLDYFKTMAEYLSVGPPVYFVVKAGHNYTTPVGQNQVCGGHGCPESSVLDHIFKASLQPNCSYIAHAASSWLDDYVDWVSSKGNPPCCRQYINARNSTDNFCKSSVSDPGHTLCRSCDYTPVNGRPVDEDFMKYLPWFLEDNPGLSCAKGGHAAYGSAVELLDNKQTIGATYFMTYHTILKESKDFIGALSYARKLAENISLDLVHWNGTHEQPASVFPYSIFYVFYEQYLTIGHEATVNLGCSLLAIFLMTFVLLGCDLWSAAIVIVTITMIVTSLFSLMFLWNITLNAISLVNLTMAVGIAVEFCSHITRDYVTCLKATRLERAEAALIHMGSSVLSGITLTKLGGIVVLAFSKSQLFQVFYFRMYFGIVLFGASHGLIFLPVFLSYFGPPLNKASAYLSTHQQDDSCNNDVPSSEDYA